MNSIDRKHNSPGKSNLVGLSDDEPASGSQIINQTALGHQFDHDVRGISKHNTQQVH